MTPDEEEEKRQGWLKRMALAIVPFVRQTYEKDWMNAANCLVEDVADVSFITEPDELSDRRWARICSKCDVFDQCLTWANRVEVHGTYIAGEWRE